MADWKIYWGETHDNTYQFAEMVTPIEESFRRAASHLDFYAAAYYVSCADAFEPGGHLGEFKGKARLVLEGRKPQARINREWAEVKSVSLALNAPGSFVTFPGYEWQGNGAWGDHNVFALREDDLDVCPADTLAELYDSLRGKDVLAIPHHTAYRPGVRGKDWSVLDETLSPFCEIYSVHGCSETDDEYCKLRSNSHMGPLVGAGTWQAALDRGLHVGCICSTDNWGEMPGCFGRGRMACMAKELTRNSIWDAFTARRVYGITGDRIKLDFTVNDAPMGSIITVAGKRRIRVAVECSDELDRIEILRNGRVIATHCHQGTWTLPRPGQISRFKMRVEAGWGPRPNELALPPREWVGELAIDGGRILGVEPCWISPGQGMPVINGNSASFTFLSNDKHLSENWQNADVFEFEADAAAPLRVALNGMEERGSVAEFAASSRELWFKDECVAMLKEHAGLEPLSPERMDIYHHMAYKAKLHRPIPQAGYNATFDIEDDPPLTSETNYRVRVEQRNAERAWSSPVWVTAK